MRRKPDGERELRGKLVTRMAAIIRVLVSVRYGLTIEQIRERVNWELDGNLCERTYRRDINAMVREGEVIKSHEYEGFGDLKPTYTLGPHWRGLKAA